MKRKKDRKAKEDVESDSRVNCLSSSFMSSVKMKMKNNLSICGAYCRSFHSCIPALSSFIGILLWDKFSELAMETICFIVWCAMRRVGIMEDKWEVELVPKVFIAQFLNLIIFRGQLEFPKIFLSSGVIKKFSRGEFLIFCMQKSGAGVLKNPWKL